MNGNKSAWIAGVARSGTSWIGQIFNSHPQVKFRFQPLFSYEFKGCIDEDSPNLEYLQFLNRLWDAETEFLTQSDKIKSGDYPKFNKSDSPNRLVFKENRYQSVIEPLLRKVATVHLIGVIRHPCAVINSWQKNAKEFPPGAVLREQWRFGNCKNSGPEDYFGFYKWKEVANLYLDLADKFKERVRVVQFEQLVKHRFEVSELMLNSIGLDLDLQTETFLAQSGVSHSDSYYAVYKNADVVSQWRKELDPYIVSEIYHDLEGTRLEPFLGESNLGYSNLGESI